MFLHLITLRYLAKHFVRSVQVQLVVPGSVFKLWQHRNYLDRSVRQSATQYHVSSKDQSFLPWNTEDFVHDKLHLAKYSFFSIGLFLDITNKAT